MARPCKYAGSMHNYTEKVNKYAEGEEDKSYIVSKKACGGCMYYRPLAWGGCGEGREMWCEYFFKTGTLRPDEPCSECSVKTVGKPDSYWNKFMVNYDPDSLERQRMGKQKREPRE